MNKFLLGLGVGIAAKWLYDTWQESQRADEVCYGSSTPSDAPEETTMPNQQQATQPDDIVEQVMDVNHATTPSASDKSGYAGLAPA